jgi:membrane protein
MLGESPQSPEARRRRLQEAGDQIRAEIAQRPAWLRGMEVAKRVVVGVYTDGFIHAGNLAYLTLVALFPFFIVAAAIAQALGRTQDGLAALNGFLLTVPHGVADVLRPAIQDVLSARTGNLLWIGSIVGLWTVGSLIETIRDILRRAYGTKSGTPFWQHRLSSIGIIFASVLGAMFALSMQVMLGTAEALVMRFLPFADDAINLVAATKLLPTAILYIALLFLFSALTPSRYRGRQFPKWPGALITTLWWYGTTLLLPVFIAHLTNYNLTYGSLAGTMIALIFFFIIGLGVVIGAELNAALADFPERPSTTKGEGITQ